MWNEEAQNTYDMMSNGTGIPLAPENIETTKKAFPILLDEIKTITAGSDGLVAFGRSEAFSGFVLVWTSKSTGSGYQALTDSGVIDSDPGKFARILSEVKRRIRRAWWILTVSEPE